MNASPIAPGSLGAAPSAVEMLSYLGALDSWLAERRAELDALDAQVIATGRQAELTADMSLALALWQAAKTRQNLLLATWDSGRVGRQELERLSALIWGRLDTAGSQVVSLQSMAVSLPEAGRLCDALVAQLRTRLNTDPNATAIQLRITGLRAQAERIRDQLSYEPPALAPAGRAKLTALISRIDDVSAKRDRGGDVTGLLSALEVDAAKLERDLIVGAARRRQGHDLLAKVRDQRTAVSAREFAARTLADQVAAAVWPAPMEHLGGIDALGPVPNTAEALSGYAAQLAALDAELTAAQTRLTQRLGERDAAVNRLENLLTVAGPAARAPDVAELVGIIRARLAATPVRLPVVQHLLDALAAELDHQAAR